jgi:monoamine oxidase
MDEVSSAATEAGAARIPDNHDLTLYYAKHLALTLVPFFPDKLARVFRIGGRRLKGQSWTDLDLSRVPLNLTAEERRLGMAGLLRKYLGGALNDIGDPREAGWPNSSS